MASVVGPERAAPRREGMCLEWFQISFMSVTLV